MSDIKAMGLYRNVERIQADLDASGIGPRQPLTVADLTPFDQYHYEGTDAVDEVCEALGADRSARLLDLGSGLGGPARYVADRVGCRVTALELQADLNDTASALTERCGLSDRVEHINGDMLEGVTESDGYSGILSMLCILHIPDRETLFSNCARTLVAGGGLVIDDYYEREPLSDGDRRALADKVFCPYLPSLPTYVADLEGAGFVDIATLDKTADWTTFVVDRLDRFRSARADLEDRYGAETVDGLDDFYTTVVDLFTSGRLGGVRISARLQAEADG